MLLWRYFQAKNSVSAITGTMMMSISKVAVMTDLALLGGNVTSRVQDNGLAATGQAGCQCDRCQTGGPAEFLGVQHAKSATKARLGVNAND